MIQNVAIFDIISLALIFILGIKGIINGFIKEVAGLIGIVGGVYLAYRFAQEAGSFVDKHIYQIQNSASLYLIGFLSVLILFWLASLIIGKIIESLLHISGLGFIDKLAGFFIGSMKIFLIFSILAITLSNISFIKEKMDSVFAKSFMYPIFIDVGQFIIKQNPNEIVKQVKEKTAPSLEETK
jgi:membrane protein required for colicin V production